MYELLEFRYIGMESSHLGSWNHTFCRKVLLPMCPYFQMLDESQDTKQTELYG